MRRDLCSAHRFLTALQDEAISHGWFETSEGFSKSSGGDMFVEDAMAHVIAQLREGYKVYTGTWKFAGWPEDNLPYRLLEKVFVREYTWAAKDGSTTYTRNLGPISHRKILLACASMPVRSAKIGKYGVPVKVPFFVDDALANLLYMKK